MSKRSSLLIAIGVTVFVLGAGLVIVSLGRHSNSPTSAQVAPAGAARSAVVVATSAVAAGTSGESLIQSQSVVLEQVPAKNYSTDDLTSLNALSGTSVIHPVAAGTPIQSSDLRAATGALTPPKGDETVALTFGSSASGLAGYLQPGDYVDLYGNVTKTTVGGVPQPGIPCVTLVEPHVLVLDVSDVVPAYLGSQPSGGRSAPAPITILLAVSPVQAATVVFYQSNEQLYLVGSQSTDTAPGGACLGMGPTGSLVSVP